MYFRVKANEINIQLGQVVTENAVYAEALAKKLLRMTFDSHDWGETLHESTNKAH